MTLSELEDQLSRAHHLRFRLPDGTSVVAHAHLTEAGETTRRFVDCGGTLRTERALSLQLWSADDVDHRLSPDKALAIISSTRARLGLGEDADELEVHVEYQGPDTIARYGLSADGDAFRLVGLTTACLALERCGLPQADVTSAVTSAGPIAVTAAPAFPIAAGACVPGQGCC